MYKYFLFQGVAGRWSHVYRPHVEGDDDVLYFQRMDRESTKGAILTTRPYSEPGKMPASEVIIYPKGLVASLEYDVRFDFDPRTVKRSGTQLMRDGIAIPQVQGGEIVFLNLPNHPGSGTDFVAPAIPRNVSCRVATHIITQGIEIRWESASDDNWLSFYELRRTDPGGTETNLGKISQGTFFFDRSLPACELIRGSYKVRAVDGDGNTSGWVNARRLAGETERQYGFSGFGSVQGFRGWSYEVTSDGVAYRLRCWPSFSEQRSPA